MNFSRRTFVKGGVTAFTFGFAAPQVLCDIAFAQGVPSRNLVVVYLSGGNDSLSTVDSVPRRELLRRGGRRLRFRPATCCRSAPTVGGVELGLHPRLDRPEDRSSTPAASPSSSAPATRTRAARTSPASTSGAPPTPATRQGTGWLGRYLDTLPPPVDPLVGVEHAARDAAPADGAPGRRAGDHEPGDLQLLEPQQRHRSRLRTHRADAHLVAPARWIARTSRS